MPLSSAYQQQQQAQQNLEPPSPSQPTTPPPESAKDWNYRDSPVNQRGEQLPAGAEGWTPFGAPYFGPGLGGTVKKYAWSLMGSPTEGDEEERWGRFLELTQSANFWSDPTSKEFNQASKEFLGGFVGTDASKSAADLDKLKTSNARLKQIADQYGDDPANMPASVQAEYKELQSIWSDPTKALGTVESAAANVKVNGVSLLTPLIRLSKVGVQGLMDVLGEASVKFEQLQGANQAMREYANEKGNLPSLAFDINRKNDVNTQTEAFWNDPAIALKSEEAQGVANLASRILMPALSGWDAFRFWMAPGTLAQKRQALQTGWDAGRMLYSQTIKPSLLEEYKRRAAAGEDPQLLTMELQNPWAEAVGQMVLDPLNVIGAINKGAKMAGMLDDATDAVRGGNLGDEAVEIMRDVNKATGETAAAGQMEKFDGLVTKAVDDLEAKRLTVDFNKATSYSPSGLRVRETKVVQTTGQIVTSAIMRNGGSADDVADFFHAMARATSAEKSTRLEAWDEIMTLSNRYGMGRYAFSDDVLETGIILRNLTDNPDDLLKTLKAGGGDLGKTAEILNKTFEKAVHKTVPTYSEVKKAAEAFEAGEDVSARAGKLAETYKGIKSKALWNLHEGTVGKAKNAINSFLGKFYFTQPGFAVRNATNNFSQMFIDQGFKGSLQSFYRDGKYWSIGAIEEDLKLYFGGQLPTAVGGITSLSQAEGASNIVTKFNEGIEAGFAKRIYWKQFRDTMDKFIQPGVALPKRDEFKALGMTDDMIDQFVRIAQDHSHGDINKAVELFTQKHGAPWKNWGASLTPEELKGIKEVDLAKEIEDITDTARTPQEVKQKIDALRRELVNRANSAVDNPAAVNPERKGFEFVEGLGKATEQGLIDVDGTNKLNILIEQSEKATDELMAAIGRARDTVQGPLRDQFGVMEQAFSASRRNGTRQTSTQLVETAWDLTKQSKKSTGLQVEQLWSQSILAKKGPPPAGLTAQRFRDELWAATRSDVSNTWETYFSEGFDRLTPLIDNLSQQYPEMQGIFAKSRKASSELQMYRTAIYRDGKIFYQQPPKSIYELANRYGIATATAEGTPANKQLLATINKYSGQKYKTLDEIPLEEAEKALQARKTGAMTAADAARVEAPKAVEGATETTGSGAETYWRYGSEKSPMSDWGHAMFSKREPDTGLAEGLTYYKYAPDPKNSVKFEDVKNKIVEKFTDWRENGVPPQYAGTDLAAAIEDESHSVDELADLFNPKDIVNSAEGYDNADFNQFFWDEILEPEGKTSIITQDGAIVYDESLINKVGRTSEEIDAARSSLKNTQTTEQAARATPTQADELGPITEPTPNPEVQIHPPYVDGSPPIPGQMWKENQDGILATLNKVEQHMLDNYGVAAGKLDGSQLKKLRGLMRDASGRITEGVAIADKIGKEWRDFALLPYGETRNFDLALSYAFPYQFWYSRSYNNWMKRIATDPQVLANYARIKETMAKVNKDSPEWWRYNVEIPSHFLGLPNEHPMSFNLEANIWPLYGLTGTDFEDPQKRVDWFTSTVDDMGKLGPSPWAPIQWGIALAYKMKGEDEVAQSWAGRMIPQTNLIKAVSPYVFGKTVEVDPLMQMFQGEGIGDISAMDKWERRKVQRALASMVQEGQLTQEQAVEVARTQDGPVWEEAINRATKLRTTGAVMSYLAGVGLKPRTEEDKQVDQFYEEYYRLQNLNEADLVSPEQYQKSWDGLRDKYPFMDMLLLSRKAGPDRDRAYAYNVFGRIPPGQASEIYKAAGLDPELVQKFYDSKGNLKGLSESEYNQLMAGAVDLGAMLAIPDSATKADWNAARSAYKSVQEQLKRNFGEDILELTDHYYSIEDSNQRKAFLDIHPEIDQAMSFQNEQVVNSDLLYEFYGGVSSLEKYWKGKVYDQLEEKYGADISKKFDTYYNMQVSDPSGAKRYYRQHPELKAYSREKDGLMDQALRKIVEFGAKLPETQPPELTGNEPQDLGQKGIQEYAQQSTPSFDYWQQQMPEVSAILADYWQSGEEIPYAVTKNLDYTARNYGYNSGDDLLQAILISMQRQQP